MQQSTWHIRLIFVIGTILIGAYVLTPSAVYFSLSDDELREVQADSAKFKQHVPSWAPTSHIVPGLDLQGGVHMVLGVDLDKAISDKARRLATRLKDDLTEKKIEFDAVDHLGEEGK